MGAHLGLVGRAGLLFHRSSKGSWDRATREFAIVCSLLLGPVYLLIAAELLLLAAMGKGLSSDLPQRYKH